MISFDLTAITLACGLAGLYAAVIAPRWRGYILLILSLAAAYALQPALPIPLLGIVFATASIGLTVLVWMLTRPQAKTPSLILTVMILLIVLLFIALKTEAVGVTISGWLRALTGTNPRRAALSDLEWLGFSYLAFRLIHVLRDRQSGLLPALTLPQFVTYALFFPSLVSGPIDRAERFQADWLALPSLNGLDGIRWQAGLSRIAMGIFKKFVIANTLAMGVALNARSAEFATSTPFTWLLVYGYAFRLFFDFSGYSDIAIGIGILFGVRLPENFDRPYFKTNITTFWQSWHMTLSTWARFYVFTPLSRTLLARKPKPPTALVVLAGHLTTMTVIGLWHGVTLNFLIWGLWHAVGLFVHKQWSDRTRKWYRGLGAKPWQKRAWTAGAWLITFHFVVLGWVWFALPSLDLSVNVFAVMFGLK